MANSESITVTKDESYMLSDEIKAIPVKPERAFGFDKTAKTDLTLLVEDKKIYVTRVILETISPAFEKIVSEQLLESEENEVRIYDKTFEDFVEFLACIYPGKMCKVTMTNVYKVIPLAIEYKIDFLAERCESVLIDEISKAGDDEKIIVQYGNTASRYNLLSLEQKCVDIIVSRRLEEIDTLDNELLLEDKARFMICAKLLPSLRSEACRNRYLSAGYKCINALNPKDFGDAKYKGIDFKLDAEKKDETVSYEVAVWGITWKINVYKREASTRIYIRSNIVKNKKLSHFSVACKVVVKNNGPISSEGDFSEQKCELVLGNRCNTLSELNLQFDMTELQESKYKMNGKYDTSVHILMDRPVYFE